MHNIINTFPGNPGLANSEKNGLMSKEDKVKLDTIEDNANNYIHPESHPASMIVETESRKFITKEEKETISKALETVTESSNGLMTKEDKIKLNGIADNANNYVHPINHPASMIVQNSSYRFVTDEEKSIWNAKADTTVASTSMNGLMSTEDKTKLDDIEEGANNYVHPSSHSATMIVEDDTHRFVTSAEKSKWNTKADTTTVTTEKDGLMSKEDKTKLDDIEEGANNYVHPSTHNASIIIQDTTHRFVTDEEKGTWNAKASTDIATTAMSGLMSSEDKVKLDTIEDNANNYVHPSSHPASIITQDTTHRFVSDEEKGTWNAKADNTVASTTINGLMSSEDKTKLDGIEEGANNYVHPSTHSASIITQDTTHRFVSDAEKALWNNKPNDKIDLGLGNVTNDAQVKRSEMGVANGVATLDADGKVPSTQLPSYVDDVLDYDNFTSFPESGEAGKIYLDTSTNKTYRWSGTQYVNIASDLALGETSSTAYAGDKGKAIADELLKIKDGTTVVPKAGDSNTVSGFTVGVNVPANAKFTDTIYTHPTTHSATMITEDSTHRFVTDAEKSKWNNIISTLILASTTANGLMSKEDKTKLDDIEEGANNYVHPSTHNASIIIQDTTHRFVTDEEKGTWNAKASTSVATTASNGLLSKEDKVKLNSVEENANNYVHPSSHPASIIDTDSTHRFVTDVEKTNWNNKANTSLVTNTTNGLMSTEDKVKLDSIESNANNYTHPTTHPATMITEDATHRFVTDTDKTNWNNKANNTHTHNSLSVIDTKADNPAPNDSNFAKKSVSFEFKSNTSIDNPPVSGSYSGIMNFAPHSDQSGGNGYQLLFGYGSSETSPKLCVRTNVLNATTWGDWEELYTTANKPKPSDIGAANINHTHTYESLELDSTHKFVTDAQITLWNDKANTTIATQTANGLMSKEDKRKIDSIESNANNYTHPTTHPATMITEDSTHRFVTDTEKNKWNNIISTLILASTTANGLMSKEDKTKLDGIATGANNYTHPTTHPATMITEDATHRFVTDIEKSNWNNKADTTVASTTVNGLMSSTDKTDLNSLKTKVATLETNYQTILNKLKTAVFI